jgi:hypothetical protein
MFYRGVDVGETRRRGTEYGGGELCGELSEAVEQPPGSRSDYWQSIY